MAGPATIMKFVACGGQARTSQRQAGGAFVVLDATVISALLVHSAWTPSSVPRMGMRHLSVMRAPPMEAHKLEALRKIEECCSTIRASAIPAPRVRMHHLSWMRAPHVTLLYTMRAPPWRDGTRTVDFMAWDWVKLTEGMCSISRVNESN